MSFDDAFEQFRKSSLDIDTDYEALARRLIEQAAQQYAAAIKETPDLTARQYIDALAAYVLPR
jgi:hypothetical protein